MTPPGAWNCSTSRNANERDGITGRDHCHGLVMEPGNGTSVFWARLLFRSLKLLYKNWRALPLIIVVWALFSLIDWPYVGWPEPRVSLPGPTVSARTAVGLHPVFWDGLFALCLYMLQYLVVAFIWFDIGLNAGRNNFALAWAKLPDLLQVQGKFWSLPLIACALFRLLLLIYNAGRNNFALAWAKLPDFLLAQGKLWSLTLVAFALFMLLILIYPSVLEFEHPHTFFFKCLAVFMVLFFIFMLFMILYVHCRLSFLVLDVLSGQKSGVHSAWRKSKGFGRDMALASAIVWVILAACMLLWPHGGYSRTGRMLSEILSTALGNVAMLMFLSIMLVAYKEAARRQMKDVSIPAESA